MLLRFVRQQEEHVWFRPFVGHRTGFTSVGQVCADNAKIKEAQRNGPLATRSVHGILLGVVAEQ